ncbi:carboxylesterase/lipase family protein [Rhodopseudomonas palustris]|nr:carboxylesterase/lipase family protein [Rhodopseudomonas palustris]RIA01694.1 carboxylesterase/lipase family protein [Rhodopseudomonas palustris]
MPIQSLDPSAATMNRRRFLGHAVGAAVLTGASSTALPLVFTTPARAREASPVVIETRLGRLRGESVEGVASFKGVPYGASTAGDNRFRPPVPPAAWTGERDATQFGPSASQPAAASPVEFAWYWSKVPTSEDNLTLSVYTPGVNDGGKRPILVWLHGGAFSIGAGTSPGFDGSHLAKAQNVVVVSINHRLNLLGSLFTGEFPEELSPASGNLSVLDQIAALKWVRDNAAAIGGDAGNVTIFGQSGGAAKVAVLLGAPAAKGLFHRAVIQSASGAWRLATPESAARSAHALLAQFDLTARNAGKLREIPADKLVAAIVQVAAKTGVADFRPTLDNLVFKQHPFDPAASAVSEDIPLLIGTTADEATFFLAGDQRNFSLGADQVRARIKKFIGLDDAATDKLIRAYRDILPESSPSELLIAVAGDYNYVLPTLLVADRKAAQGKAPVYAYRFDWRSPARDGVLGSPHTAEVPFIFGTLDAAAPLIGDSPDRLNVRDRIGEIWASFARSGRPTTKAIAEWKPYRGEERTAALIGGTWRTVDDHAKARRAAFADIAPYEYSRPVTFTRD